MATLREKLGQPTTNEVLCRSYKALLDRPGGLLLLMIPCYFDNLGIVVSMELWVMLEKIGIALGFFSRFASAIFIASATLLLIPESFLSNKTIALKMEYEALLLVFLSLSFAITLINGLRYLFNYWISQRQLKEDFDTLTTFEKSFLYELYSTGEYNIDACIEEKTISKLMLQNYLEPHGVLHLNSDAKLCANLRLTKKAMRTLKKFGY